MRNLKLTIAYKGTAYHGFQVQKNAVTVAEVFQDAVEAVFGTRYDIKGCSRTDAGVHASAFVLSLRINEAIPCGNILKALNSKLPADIAVLHCEEAAEDFHPRYSAIAKRYSYTIFNNAVRSPFAAETSLHLPRPLQVEQMNAAAGLLVGYHDFSAFCAAGSSVEDHRRTVTKCEVTAQGDIVTLNITGDGFLYNMVRIIVGTLIEVGYGRLQPQEVAGILAGCDRSRAGATAPAHGLRLEQVYYQVGG